MTKKTRKMPVKKKTVRTQNVATDTGPRKSIQALAVDILFPRRVIARECAKKFIELGGEHAELAEAFLMFDDYYWNEVVFRSPAQQAAAQIGWVAGFVAADFYNCDVRLGPARSVVQKSIRNFNAQSRSGKQRKGSSKLNKHKTLVLQLFQKYHGSGVTVNQRNWLKAMLEALATNGVLCDAGTLRKFLRTTKPIAGK